VLAEKNIGTDIIDVNISNPPEDLLDLNTYNSIPVLVDRDLVLYNSQIIMEYLDERFPHPPLMPVDPVSRARTRIMLYRIDKDWYSILDDINGVDAGRSEQAIKTIREGLSLLSPVLTKKPYFMSDDFALVDCSLAPILWRLSYYGIELPTQAKPMKDYARRLFDRETFQTSLSEIEREIGGMR